MILGFTGTRTGMTPFQAEIVRGLFEEHTPTNMRHGDCVGADADFHIIAHELGVHGLIHPPTNPKQRYFAECSHCVIFPVQEYLVRDRAIVDGCDILIGTPGEYQPRMRSGTWYTLKYARNTNKRFVIVFPDGSMRDSWE